MGNETKKRSGNFRNAFSLGDNPVRLHLAHGSARIVTDAGACRFTASLLTRFLVITIIAKLLQQAFLIHNLLQALESTLDRLALLQSELDHACHLLSPLPCLSTCLSCAGPRVKEMVVGLGFEPRKASASRFTVCPGWPLRYPTRQKSRHYLKSACVCQRGT